MAGSTRAEVKSRSRKGGMVRALKWLAFVPVASRAPMYARLIWSLATDPRISPGRKAVLAGAVGYLILGRDVIPDDIPVLGGVDDLAVVVLAVEVFFDGIPEEILDQKLEELAIDPAAFRRDIDQIRRLTPAPVRRMIRRLPDILDSAVQLLARAQLGPKVRSFVTKPSIYRSSAN